MMGNGGAGGWSCRLSALLLLPVLNSFLNLRTVESLSVSWSLSLKWAIVAAVP